ncbi:hypothetical protein [Caballeronia sp. LZ034LL]|uniref:hypothetical protein n=1 Tax=Caballeronia sp. LZ034LL TaxID=3038567 RepID=UPI00286758E0|nr:hypothetical protein [Caballeronia sp. LZ034LL]MDR5836986.1 hypothetical protein [Caballeronia sp. LZ034LL]
MISRRRFIAVLPALGLSLAACRNEAGSCSSAQGASIDRLVAFAKQNIASVPEWTAELQWDPLAPTAKTLLASLGNQSGDAALRSAVAASVSGDMRQNRFVEKAGVSVTQTEMLLMGLSSGALTADRFRAAC